MLPAICLLGFLGSILLLKFADKVNPANRYLAYHFFLNALFGIAHWASVVSDSIELRALFAIHYFPLYLLNSPFLYFYVRAVLTEKKFIRGFDYIHFLPILLIIINIIPYSINSWEYKLSFAEKIHANSKNIYLVYFPLISFSSYFIGRSIISIFYLILAGGILMKSIRQGKLKSAEVLRKWLLVYLTLGLIFNLSIIFLSVYSFYSNGFMILLDEKGRGRSFVTIIMSFLTISIYFFPRILYGLNTQPGSKLTDVFERNEKIASASKSLEISEARLFQVEGYLVEFLQSKKYLLPGFALSDLVKDLGVPEHILTYYFNNYLGVTFLKWKNQLRIEEAVNLLKAGEAETNTLESVGKACGYKSRSNFIQAFKAQTGESPSAYLKKLL